MQLLIADLKHLKWAGKKSICYKLTCAFQLIRIVFSIFNLQLMKIGKACHIGSLCLFLLLASAYVTTVKANVKLDLVTLQLNKSHHFQFAGYYAAIEQGFYRAAGLNVVIKQARAEENVVEQVISGQANYAIGTSKLLIERNHGKPVVALAAIFQHSPQIVTALLPAQVETDLTNNAPTLATKADLATQDLTQQAVYILNGNMDTRSDPIKQYISNIPKAFLKNADIYSHDTNSNVIDTYGGTLFTSEQEILKHPKRVQSFRSASLKGWQYAMQNQAEIAALIHAKYQPELSIAAIEFEAHIITQLMLYPLIDIGYTNTHYWHNVANLLVQDKRLNSHFVIDGIEFKPNQPQQHDWGIVSIAIIALLISIWVGILLIFNRRLQRTIDMRIKQQLTEKSILKGEIDNRKQTEQALLESKEHLRISQLYGHIGTWETNYKTNKETWSETISQELGFPHISSPTWNDFLAVIHPNDRNKVEQAINRHVHENEPCDIEYRIVDTDKKTRWMHTTGSIEYDASGEPFILRGTVQDITVRKLAEEQLRLYSRMFIETHEGIAITDQNGIIIDVNPAFSSITDYSREQIIGKHTKILSSDKHKAEFYDNILAKLNKDHHWQGEVWSQKSDGQHYAALLTISSIFDENQNILHYVGLFTDITHSKKQQETLALMAHYDVLTQLPNRILLADRFIQAVAHCNHVKNLLAVCFLDLDNFKPVNDTYGHEVGDKLIVEVAKRIKNNIREEDTVSRQGGDEFALLLGDIKSANHCELMLDRILSSLAQPYLIDQQTIYISASIGVSVYPTDHTDLDTLIRHADQAMYQAKLAGRNSYRFFNAEQDQKTIQKHIHLQEIQNALANNEFCLFYQPKVNMTTGAVFGAEALIRWQHPEKGLIPPLKFLPIIEQTELEIEIGQWVIDEALKQLNLWTQQGLELEISINVSSYHLQSPEFVDELATALNKYSYVQSNLVQLEILESSALGDLKAISNIIKTCKETLGVNVALDDFGTGYSSLTHLRNLSANTIKIDQTFVRDVLDDPNDYAIIDGVIGLANSFNRAVIAEGIETTQHGLMLLIMGCNSAQGFGIARPMPAKEIPDWLENYEPNLEWINCGTTERTPKEAKITLFKLALNQWITHFEKNIKDFSNAKDNDKNPIDSECLCEYWIKRARQENLFEESCLSELDEIHESIHQIAHELNNNQILDINDTTGKEFEQIHSTFNKMSQIISAL